MRLGTQQTRRPSPKLALGLSPLICDAGAASPGGRDPVRGHVSPPVISLLSPAAVPEEALGGANSAGGEPRQPHPRPLEHAASPTEEALITSHTEANVR